MVPPWCNSEGICCVAQHYKTIDQVILSWGVELRRVRRLRWGHNCDKGPSALWHMDLYDKLKPYSTAIGCYSGGFNCYVVWMEAYRTNGDLELIEHRHSPRCCTCCWRLLEAAGGSWRALLSSPPTIVGSRWSLAFWQIHIIFHFMRHEDKKPKLG